ncbi:hypothetical protein [Agromyces archimandritae]|uniref:Uncharacterized protein n=1 Tax=Agromyces archimandritae TaxID=2781962 RepID=A0A975FPJ7_9MICO|nr:hypothetical protein [Agromyces archimandritae]QTX05934.1 hypothetical protein G127AT_07010 [Agromyces archimandritae]
MPGTPSNPDSRRASRVRRGERRRPAGRPPRTARGFRGTVRSAAGTVAATVSVAAHRIARTAGAASRRARAALAPLRRRMVRIGRLTRLAVRRGIHRASLGHPERRGAASGRRLVLLGAGALATVAIAGFAINTGVQAGVGNGGDVGAVIDAIEAGESLPYDDADEAVAGDGTLGTPIKGGAPRDDDATDTPDPTVEQPSPTGKPEEPATQRPTPTPTPPVTTQRPHPPVSQDPADPMSPKYNPYTTPGDPAFVSDAERRAWLGREAVVRECMADAGFEYLEWQWWFGGSPQPQNLGSATAAWMQALRGSGSGSAEGCEAVGQRAADEAEAAGTPLQGELLPQPDGPTEREQWIQFQDAVRGCMNTAGQEYLYWEHWNPAYESTDGALPAMPTGLDKAERAAWEDLLYGGAASSEGATSGCWAQGAAETGYASWR